jgi:hypothetical protein
VGAGAKDNGKAGAKRSGKGSIVGEAGLLLEGESAKEFVGTFRWGPAHVFQPLPTLPDGLSTAYAVVKDWKTYFAFRCAQPG